MNRVKSQTGCFYFRFLQLLVVSNLFVAICSALIIELPLKKLRLAGEYDWSSYVRRERLRYPRAASVLNLDMNKMVNNIRGESSEGYYTTIQIGTPPQEVHVIIDTGSANFAIACEKTGNITGYFDRKKSSSYSRNGTSILVQYTEGNWKGMLGYDFASLKSSPPLRAKVNVACIEESTKFYTSKTIWHGILGMSYAELARPDSSIEPFWDGMLRAHPALKDVFSVNLCGSSNVHTSKKTPEHTGSLILGGYLKKLAASPFFYTPIHKKWYYEVIIADIEVERTSLDLNCKEYNTDKTIVDSGTTSIRLPSKVFHAIKKSVIKSIKAHGKLTMPNETFFGGDQLICYEDMTMAFSAFPVVSFYLMISEHTAFRMDLTPQHYLRSITTMGDEVPTGMSCVKYGFMTSDAGTVLGAIFIEAFYTVFDRANDRIGFAQSACPLPDPANKLLDVTIEGPFNFTQNLEKCAFKKPKPGLDMYVKATIIFLAFSMVLVVPLCVMVFYKTLSADRLSTAEEDTRISESLMPVTTRPIIITLRKNVSVRQIQIGLVPTQHERHVMKMKMRF